MNKYILALVITLSACASTNKETNEIKVYEPFVAQVWVEKNSKTDWFDLVLNTKSQSKVTILTSKNDISHPIRSKDGELLAYISKENKNKPILYLQNIYSPKRKKFDVLLDETSKIEFSQNEKAIIVKTRNVSKEIPISKVLKEI